MMSSCTHAGDVDSIFGGIGMLRRPGRACALERTALPIPWMGPSFIAGLGGPSRTASATTRAQVRPPMPTHACASGCRCHICTQTNADTSILLVAQVMPRPSAPSSPPTSRRRRRHHRCRGIASHRRSSADRMCARGCVCARHPGPSSDPKQPVCAHFGCSFVGARSLGGRGRHPPSKRASGAAHSVSGALALALGCRLCETVT